MGPFSSTPWKRRITPARLQCSETRHSRSIGNTNTSWRRSWRNQRTPSSYMNVKRSPAPADRTRPAWSGPLERRRLTILSVLVLAVSAIKVSEEVIGGESGPVDKAILLFIHSRVPGTLTGFFEAVTFTGSSRVLFPLATVATIALLCARRRLEALLLAASVISEAARS